VDTKFAKRTWNTTIIFENDKLSMSSGAPNYHFFWRKGSPFSQWHSSNYTLDGYQYSSAEQGMMHGKALMFGDEEVGAQIMQTSDPRKIKRLGRNVKGFSDREWKKHRKNIVYRNNIAKFTQNDHYLLKALMTTTGLLVEASPSDQVWGIGMHENEAKKVPESQWKGFKQSAWKDSDKGPRHYSIGNAFLDGRSRRGGEFALEGGGAACWRQDRLHDPSRPVGRPNGHTTRSEEQFGVEGL
jgi:ribA/ribD-fused uncharacterized protein